MDNYQRRQEVKRVYRNHDGVYQLEDCVYTEDWDMEKRRSVAKEISSTAYITYLALEKGEVIAFVALQFFVKIPEYAGEKEERILVLAKEGLRFLKDNPMIMTLILFMSGVNLVASAFDASLPGYVLPNSKGGQTILGIVTSCSGVAMIAGSLLVSVLPKPKDRIRAEHTLWYRKGFGCRTQHVSAWRRRGTDLYPYGPEIKKISLSGITCIWNNVTK